MSPAYHRLYLPLRGATATSPRAPLQCRLGAQEAQKLARRDAERPRGDGVAALRRFEGVQHRCQDYGVVVVAGADGEPAAPSPLGNELRRQHRRRKVEGRTEVEGD